VAHDGDARASGWGDNASARSESRRSWPQPRCQHIRSSVW